MTQHIPEGELLYIGIGKTRVQGDDGSDAADRAIANMEKVLNVPPNDAFFGSARSRFRDVYKRQILHALLVTYTSILRAYTQMR